MTALDRHRGYAIKARSVRFGGGRLGPSLGHKEACFVDQRHQLVRDSVRRGVSLWQPGMSRLRSPNPGELAQARRCDQADAPGGGDLDLLRGDGL